ncbi:MAG TPA: hypothetical protein VGB51_08210 [Actinomycetota bacterium]
MPDAPLPTPADLGVLFVHGIGSQKAGQTLLQFGEPLFRWLFRWLGDGTDPGGDDSNRSVRLTGTELEPGGGPASCTVTIEAPPGPTGEPDTQRWLLAESWWAEAFTPPPFTKLAFWLMTYTPWLALDFMARIVRRAIRQPSAATLAALLSLPLLLLIGPIVGVLLFVLILALLLVYLIPLALTRTFAERAAVALTGSVGDAFILMQSPLNHGAIKQRIEGDLAWLSERCDRVAVVSHSQGAALSHAVLADGEHPQVKLFLSVGSAVRRLAEIRQLRRSGRSWQWAGWLSLVAGACLSVGVGAGIVLLLGGRLDRWPSWLRGWPLGVEMLGALALLALAYRVVWKTFTKDRAELLLPDTGSGMRWVDCFATADPVPNGPLLDDPPASPTPPTAPYTAIPTFNRRWLLNDHVTYTKNTDQFLTRLARELAHAASFVLHVGPADEEWFDDAERIRRVRTSWLNAFRTMFIVAAAFMTWGVAHTGARSPRSNLVDVAESVRGALPGWVWTGLTAVLRPLEGPLRGLGIGQNELAGALLLLIAVVLAYALIAAGWSFWDRRDTDRLFLRSVRLRTLGAALFSVAAVAAVAGCVTIGLLYA